MPLRDADGVIQSLQFIAPDGTKRFLAGGRVQGCCFTVTSNPTGPLVLCEGYATGASLHEATGYSVICAMNCGNLPDAADAARKHWPQREIILAADDDQLTNGNPGLSKATAAAKAIRARLAVPQFRDTTTNPTDFNDLHQLEGLDTVKKQIDAAPFWHPSLASVTPQSEAITFDQITAEMRGQIIGLLTSKTPPATVRDGIPNLVVATLARIGRFYYHADLRDFNSCMFFDAKRKLLARTGSDAFGAWLSEWVGINRAEVLFRFIQSAVETAALSGPLTTGIVPEAYWARRDGALYLSNGDGQIARIKNDGVAIVDNGTDGVLFAAGRTLTAWKITTPRDAFETCRLFSGTNCEAAHGKDLLRLWLYSLATNPRSKPPLCLAGEIGSGKTRTVKGMAELLGLPFIAQKVEEDAESSFWPCVNDGGIYCLDNADTKCRWLPDALANAATDGCSQRRKLYTNSETVTLRARAWLAITTANPTFASDAGLADRLLLLRLGRHTGETSDGALSDEITANRDAGLSHMATVLRAALADSAPVPTGLNRRHPDFAAFAVKIGRALGRESEAVAALKQAEADKSAFCLENDSIGAALLNYLNRAKSFNGPAADLVSCLVSVDGELAGQLSAKRLGKRLAAIWPHLQGVLEKCQKHQDRNKITIFTFKAAGYAGF